MPAVEWLIFVHLPSYIPLVPPNQRDLKVPERYQGTKGIKFLEVPKFEVPNTKRCLVLHRKIARSPEINGIYDVNLLYMYDELTDAFNV